MIAAEPVPILDYGKPATGFSYRSVMLIFLVGAVGTLIGVFYARTSFSAVAYVSHSDYRRESLYTEPKNIKEIELRCWQGLAKEVQTPAGQSAIQASVNSVLPAWSQVSTAEIAESVVAAPMEDAKVVEIRCVGHDAAKASAVANAAAAYLISLGSGSGGSIGLAAPVSTSRSPARPAAIVGFCTGLIFGYLMIVSARTIRIIQMRKTR